MPEYLAPGVYVEEVSFRAGPIEALPTGVAGFAGGLPAGPELRAIRIHAVSDLATQFGQDAMHTPLGAAVDGYFANGGGVAHVVRQPPGRLAEALGTLAGTGIDLLCLPDTAAMGEVEAQAAVAEAIPRAAGQGWLYLVDHPDAGDVVAWAGDRRLRDPTAALYSPRLLGGDGSVVPVSGPVAGVIARTDRARGVWKAPAGTEAVVHGVRGPAVRLSARQRDALVAAGVNPFLSLPTGEVVVWGSRTLSVDPEWRYVPVRRTLVHLERSIEAGLQWAVFEPNDEPLWQRVRAAVEEFLVTMWRAGAFPATAPDWAFYVRCDRTTMTEADIAGGRLVVEIGVAPVRPAEFLRLRVSVSGAGSLRRSTLDRLGSLGAAAEFTEGGHPVLLAGGGASERVVAAGHLARETDRSLVRVDLSRVVSEYIGETEKNLSAVLAHARETGAVLLFDEADALFGKRTADEDPATVARLLAAHHLPVVLAAGDRSATVPVTRAWGRRPPVVRLPDPD